MSASVLVKSCLMSFGLQTLSAIARIAGLGLLYSPAIYSLMLSICSLKRFTSEGRKRWERGGSKVKEASRKILERLGHVKICNMHLQMYICSVADKLRPGSDSFTFQLNRFKSLVYK